MARIEVVPAGDLSFELKNVHFRPLFHFLFLTYLQLINLFRYVQYLTMIT